MTKTELNPNGGAVSRAPLAGLRPKLNNKKLSRSSRFEGERNGNQKFP